MFGILPCFTLTALILCVSLASAAPIGLKSDDALHTLVLDGSDWRVTNANGSIAVPAQVPGNIFTDLLASNVIGEPYYRYGDADYRWVGNENWTYKKTFIVPSNLIGSDRVVLLECDGLDTVVNIMVNGYSVGYADNMFRRYQFDITHVIGSPNNTASIVFNFQSAASYAKAKADAYPYSLPTSDSPAQHGEPFRNLIRKEQSSFSWDWGPCFLTQGIWKSVRIVSYSAARLESTAVSVKRHSKPGSKTWTISVSADVSVVATMNLAFAISLDGYSVAKKSVSALPGQVSIIVSGDVENPRLWWPIGYGSPDCYNLTVTMMFGSHSQVQHHTIGFREIKIVEEPVPGQHGATFGLNVNGIPVFAKGANFIPADAFESRITVSYLHQILRSAADANMNIVRVWGGGIYQREAFYEEASRLGIMIWEEFMFACAMMPRNQDFLDNVAEEVRYQVRRLMHFPCIAVWSGNNENEAALEWFQETRDHRDRYVVDQVKLYVDTIRATLLESDSSRPFVFSSPSNGPLSEDPYVLRWGNPQSPLRGDVHYYNYMDDCTDLSLVPAARFMSEYGFQSFDSLETLAPTLDGSKGDFAYNSDIMNWRQHHDNGTNQIIYQAQLHFKYTPKNQSVEDFKNFIYISQTMQTHCIRAWSEYLRRGRDLPQRTQGAIYWQLNQIWPGPSWSSIEYGGRWKMLHYAARHFYSQIIVTTTESNPGNITIYATSDSMQIFSGTLEISVQLWQTSRTLTPPVLSPVKVLPLSSSVSTFTLPRGVIRNQAFVLIRILDQARSEVARNIHYLTKLKDTTLSSPNIKLGSFSQPNNNTITFTASSINPAPYTWLESPLSGRFSDNGFLLVPTIPMTLSFWSQSPVSLSSFQSSLSVTSLYDVSDA